RRAILEIARAVARDQQPQALDHGQLERLRTIGAGRLTDHSEQQIDVAVSEHPPETLRLPSAQEDGTFFGSTATAGPAILAASAAASQSPSRSPPPCRSAQPAAAPSQRREMPPASSRRSFGNFPPTTMPTLGRRCTQSTRRSCRSRHTWHA